MRATSPRVVIKNSPSDRACVKTDSEDADFPRSYDKSWRRPQPVVSESKALTSLKAAWEANPGDVPEYEGYKAAKDILIVDLEDFEIYTSPEATKHAYELSSLEFLDVLGRKLCFNGFLSIGNTRHFVEAVSIETFSIEGYGEAANPDVDVYLKSQVGSRENQYDIWYRLKDPTQRYRRFDSAFRWVARLGKHVVDYLEYANEAGRRDVGLDHFRNQFCRWLIARYPNSCSFRTWMDEFGRNDFRAAVHAHMDYLGQEAYNQGSGATAILRHPLWADCMRDDNPNIEVQPIVCTKTVVTPQVYECFKNRYFAQVLLEMEPSKAVRKLQESRKRALAFPVNNSLRSRHESAMTPQRVGDRSFEVGDVIAIQPDDIEHKMWRNTQGNEWFGYVHRVELFEDGIQRLFVLWLYRPEDTTIHIADYPVDKELFMSDHCNCNEPELLSTDVARRCAVDWFSTALETEKDFLVRQSYITEDSSFVTLRKGHFDCDCKKPKPLVKYEPGDCVYITRMKGGCHILDPVVVDELDSGEKRVRVRELLRLNQDSEETPKVRRQPAFPNELVWTDEFSHVPIGRIARKCNVRFFAKKDVLSRTIPFPYNRGGSGDYWILSSQLRTAKGRQYIDFLHEAPARLNQSAKLRWSFEKLAGLSLFSGCGNLDRGFEAAGTVEFRTSIDISAAAIHTLRANAHDPDSNELKLWCGSVDDYLHSLLSAKGMGLVAQIGEVHVVAAGSPCPGFSTLQHDWQNKQSLRNASHVTTFCSFVDVYRPKFAFLENVVNMACVRKGFESEPTVLSQIVACLVTLGYQVRQTIMDSWNYGSPQQRSRLIISIAAPGLSLPDPPRHTHSHPDNIQMRSIGTLLNGQKFGTREDYPTPFPFVTAGEATSHLPDIGNGHVRTCIPFPDHRVLRLLNCDEQTIVDSIPTYPPGQGFAEALKLGLVPKRLRNYRKEVGKSYRRIKEAGLIPTLTTAPSAHDSRNGAVMHWEQNRLISIEDSRIAQGIPEDEVIIGTLTEQSRMIGNAVDRKVAEALGLSLRKAVEENSTDDERSDGQPDCDIFADELADNSRLSSSGPKSETDGISRSSAMSKSIAFARLPISKHKQAPTTYGAVNTKNFLERLSGTLTESVSCLRPSLFRIKDPAPPTVQPQRTLDVNNQSDELPTVSSRENPSMHVDPIDELSLRAKRTSDDDDDTIDELHPDSQANKPSKKARHLEDFRYPSAPSSDGEPTEPQKLIHPGKSTHPHRTSRKTRHSGLTVEYVPRSWNMIPEKEVKRTKERPDYA